MSLFNKPHVVTVPPEYLADDDPPIQLRFKQLNSGKMAKANQADTLASISRQNEIMLALSEDQRKASLDRQRTLDSKSIERAQERAAEPDTFDDFDNHKLVALAQVRYREGDDWKVLTDEEIDELLCLDWLAGQIYDVSKPKSAKAREGNS